MIKILFAGDFVPPQKENDLYSTEIRAVLKDKDYSIVNLETPLTESTSKIEKTGCNFKRPPSLIQHVKDGYFDAVTLSNNHIRDYGDEGVIDTLTTCEQNHILTVGAGKNINEAAKPLSLDIKGKKISILNYSEKEFNIATENRAGANPYNLIDAFYQIRNEKERNDFVIVIYHGGFEYQYYPTPEMNDSFKFMVDAGADVIVAHHTHRYSGAITYCGKPIIFGLGNFLCSTISKITDEWLTGLMVEIILEENAIDFKLVPVKMSDNCEKVNLIKSINAERVLDHINKISSSIINQSVLLNYWLKKDRSERDRIMRLIKSNSKLEYRLRKYLPDPFNNRLSHFKKNTFLNMIRCDSHKNSLIRILENYQ